MWQLGTHGKIISPAQPGVLGTNPPLPCVISIPCCSSMVENPQFGLFPCGKDQLGSQDGAVDLP